jgi:hypothetical protein
MHDGNQQAKSYFCAQGKASFKLIKLPENKKLKGTEGCFLEYSINTACHQWQGSTM